MDFEKLMQKRISRKDFLKSLGFILLALVFFPRKALSLFQDDEKEVIRKEIQKEKEKGNDEENPFSKEIRINGVKVMEIEE